MKLQVPKWTGTYHPFHRRWPKVSRKATWWLMLAELAVLIPCLTIFGISQPDLYRSDLWKIGFDNKLNSNPNMILYAYANHRPLPSIPFVWSRTLTDFNVAISVISLFFLLAKLIAFIMRYWFPIMGVIVHICLAALYAVSVYGQVGPDYADDRYPAYAAWYFRYGCDMAKPYGAYKSCQIAQASLGLSATMLAVYLTTLGFALYGMWPNPENDLGHDEDEDIPTKKEVDNENGELEMQGMTTPMAAGAMPFTPRTQAFHTLNRELPLRQEQHSRFA